jgi:hypothetical protein
MSTGHALHVPVLLASSLVAIIVFPELLQSFWRFRLNYSPVCLLCVLLLLLVRMRPLLLSARSLLPMPTWAGVHIIFRFVLSSASRSFSSAYCFLCCIFFLSHQVTE